MIFLDKPSDSKSQITVVAAYVLFSSKILLLERLPTKPQGGMFGLPAGKVDAGETVENALVREIFEETGLNINSQLVDFVDRFYVEHDGLQFEYHTYKIEFEFEPNVQLRPEEHVSYCWVTPSESLKLSLVEDQAFCTKHSFGL